MRYEEYPSYEDKDSFSRDEKFDFVCHFAEIMGIGGISFKIRRLEW